MSWTLLIGIIFVLAITLIASVSRRAELKQMAGSVKSHDRAVRGGAHKAQLQHPIVDLTRCLGCATCVAACPEDGVLELVHGQAKVVNGARCVGIANCERECPTGAITVTLSNLEQRDDIPALDDELEAVGTPGLFLAGEVTAHALIKTAVDHGSAVGAEVARRMQEHGRNGDNVLDLLIVGAGPAGLACALEARRQGLYFALIDQENEVGGTVAKYPRRKLVMSEPMELPIYGRLAKTTYSKEELIEVWQHITHEQQLPTVMGEEFQSLERDANGYFVSRTAKHTYFSRYVCLALGRRGVPRRLDIPGEELPKVAYSLIDANSFQNRRVLVIGGGDSAVEAAMGLAEQPGNEVTLSYRQEAFFRIRGKNEKRLNEYIAENRINVLMQSQVLGIGPETVEVSIQNNGAGPRQEFIPNDDVFVMTGGVPPIELLSQSGVSFDASLRDIPPPVTEQGSGLTKALAIGLLISLGTLGFALWHYDYYGLPAADRATSLKHDLLRPSQNVGLWLGITSIAMILFNLLYLVRRSPRSRIRFGSLQVWMTSHIATGIFALLCAMLHGAMAPRDTIGGHAFLALTVLLVTGAIGRYFYAYVPRATNGRELALDEVKNRLNRLSEDWDQEYKAFADRARTEVLGLSEARRWTGSFLSRVGSLIGVQRDLRRTLKRLAAEGQREGVPSENVHETLQLAKRAHRTALMTAHYEDVRAILSSWRYLHRWVAMLMVLLVAVHVIYALAYGESIYSGGRH